MSRDTNNPFASPSAEDSVGVISTRFSPRLGWCIFGWLIGVSLLSILVAVDTALGNKLPGGFLYVALLLSPVITLIASFVAPVPIAHRVLAFIASLVLIAVLFVVLGVFLLSTSGFEGVH